MGQSERKLSELGRHVAELQDRAPEARLDRERGRARLLSEELSLRAPESRRSSRFLAAALVAAALFVSFGVLFFLRSRDAMRFELGPSEPGIVGAWIAAPADAAMPIRFSDGSLLHLAPGGRARVASIDADGADVALERGALELSVVHQAHTRWLVRVGPFQVHVIGTRFETSWDPVTEQFAVALREGAITVSGPVVGDSRAVGAGERLTVSTSKRTLEVGSIDTAAALPTAAPPPPVLAPSTPSASVVTPPPPASASAARAAEVELRPTGAGGSVAVAQHDAPGWRALALDAKYKDALAAAELEGFDGICAAASASDLSALGTAARLGGSAARSGQAYAALRKRFPGSPEAASAAFILGRIAQDQSKDYASAARWFTRYLSEQPGGAFAVEASGRLVEAEDKLGDQAGARRAAERYLAAYPNGLHAGYAKGVLARSASPAPEPSLSP